MKELKCPKCGSEKYWFHRKFADIWYECAECGYSSKENSSN